VVVRLEPQPVCRPGRSLSGLLIAGHGHRPRRGVEPLHQRRPLGTGGHALRGQVRAPTEFYEFKRDWRSRLVLVVKPVNCGIEDLDGHRKGHLAASARRLALASLLSALSIRFWFFSALRGRFLSL
jgi:hypothetical protein